MSRNVDLELIREMAPLDGEPSDRVRERGRDALRAHVQGRRRTRRQRVRVPALASVGFALAAAAVGVVLLVPRGSVVRPDSAAAALLERAARTAEAAGGPRQLRPSEYWYVRSRGTTFSSFPLAGRQVPVLVSYERRAWLGVRHPGLVLEHPVAVHFLTAAGRAWWESHGRHGAGLATSPWDQRWRPAGGQFGDGWSYRYILELPTRVDALERVVSRLAGSGAGPAHSNEMFTMVGDLLREVPLPAGVRAALYRMAARIPGVRSYGLTRDALGRPALAIGDTYAQTRFELLFDPRTARLLAERGVFVHAPQGLPSGTLRGEVTYVQAGIAERAGHRPR